MAKQFKLNDRQWTEIFLAGFVIAFIVWLLHHYKNDVTETSTPNISIPVQTSVLQPIGIPPLTLAGKNCSCGNNCAAGTISPGIQQIVNNTNAALAAIQAGGIQTLKTLATLGNDQGYATFEIR